MVVEEDGVYAIADGMVGLARADVDGEYRMDDGEYEKMQLGFQELSNPKGEASVPGALLFAFLVFFRGRKVWLLSSD